MKALSVRQPWAWAIFHGKPVENRSRRAIWDGKPVRGRILIHAAKTFDLCAIRFVEMTIPGMQIPCHLKTGGIIGEVTLIDCVEEMDSPWFFGPYGYVFENPKELPFVPMPGKLGFFEVPGYD